MTKEFSATDAAYLAHGIVTAAPPALALVSTWATRLRPWSVAVVAAELLMLAPWHFVLGRLHGVLHRTGCDSGAFQREAINALLAPGVACVTAGLVITLVCRRQIGAREFRRPSALAMLVVACIASVWLHVEVLNLSIRFAFSCGPD